MVVCNSVALRRDLSILFNRIAIIILIYCINIALANVIYLRQGLSLHAGLIHITSITQIFQIFIFIITILILLLTSFSFTPCEFKIFINLRKYKFNVRYENFNLFTIKKLIPTYKFFNKTGENLIEYPLILLFIITGGILLISTNDLISIFLSIELQSYGLYLLSTIYRNSELSTSGGLIYFLLGGLSSSLILLGISLLYINSGTTNLDNIYVITSISHL
jgi:NADH-ubiquinone oxidoreductase chain 2